MKKELQEIKESTEMNIYLQSARETLKQNLKFKKKWKCQTTMAYKDSVLKNVHL